LGRPLRLGHPGNAAPPSKVDQISINVGYLPHFADIRLRALRQVGHRKRR